MIIEIVRLFDYGWWKMEEKKKKVKNIYDREDRNVVKNASKGYTINERAFEIAFNKFFKELKEFLTLRSKKNQAKFILAQRGYLFHTDDEEDKGFFEEVKIGEIYIVNFSLGFGDEMSFEHPGLIVEKNENFLYVVPGTSSLDPLQSYHLEHPDKDKNFYLIKQEESFFSKEDKRTEYGYVTYGLEKDTTFLLQNLQAISINRIINRKKIGEISDKNSKILEEIRELIFQNVYKRKNDEIIALKEEIEYFYYKK